jgi:hypothetical protein
LPAAVKKARIMRFGYQSAWFADEIRTDVVAVADKLLALLRDNRKVRVVHHTPLHRFDSPKSRKGTAKLTRE